MEQVDGFRVAAIHGQVLDGSQEAVGGFLFSDALH